MKHHVTYDPKSRSLLIEDEYDATLHMTLEEAETLARLIMTLRPLPEINYKFTTTDGGWSNRDVRE